MGRERGEKGAGAEAFGERGGAAQPPGCGLGFVDLAGVAVGWLRRYILGRANRGFVEGEDGCEWTNARVSGEDAYQTRVGRVGGCRAFRVVSRVSRDGYET